MNAAVRVEAVKLLRSQVGVVATAVIVGGLAALTTGIMAAAASGRTDLIAKLGPAATADWDGLVGTAAQILGAGGVVGFGVVLAWMFAREFADNTIGNLFALPVGRASIAAAKLLVFCLWAGATSLVAVLGLAVAGFALGFGWPDADALGGLGRLLGLGILTAAVVTPVAWVSTLSRSLLAGVATTILIVVIAQVAVIAGTGGWMPVAAPALWATGAGGGASPPQLLLSVATGAAFAVLTAGTWHRLQLDR